MCVFQTPFQGALTYSTLFRLSPFVQKQGGDEHFGKHCPTKTFPLCCDMTLGRQSHVPAKLFY